MELKSAKEICTALANSAEAVLKDAEPIMALIDALPKCVKSGKPATHGFGSGYVCDEHHTGQKELSYASQLRSLMTIYNEQTLMDKYAQFYEAVGKIYATMLDGTIENV